MGDNIAIILAGGESRRMKSKTTKVLHPILGWPVIHYVFQAAFDAGIRRSVVVVNAKNRDSIAACSAEFTVRNPDFIVETAIQEQSLGTADAVQSGLRKISPADRKATALILCGDAPLIRGQSIRTLLDAHASAKAVVSVLSGLVGDSTGYGRIVRDESGVFSEIVEQKDANTEQLDIREINSGCLAIDLAALEDLLEAVPAAPTTGEFYLTRVVDIAKSRNQIVQAIAAMGESEVLGINTRLQLASATKLMRERINEAHMNNGVTIVDPASTFIGPEATIAADTIIQPNVVIEGPVAIGADCKIGPFARLRGRCEIEDDVVIGNFVEVVRTKVQSGSKVLHFGYLGDSKVGIDVNIGAGTIFANFDGQKTLSGAVGDRAFIGSGTIVVHPSTVGKDARTAAGAVVVNDLPSGETWAGIPAKAMVSSIASRETRVCGDLERSKE